jgi:hypothetical protein
MNFMLSDPTVVVPNWPQQAQEWRELNLRMQGNPGFYPLTVKGAYVVGIIHDICTSISCLLHPGISWQTTYMPAYGLFASIFDILGRCINGNAGFQGSTADTKTGFKWLVSSDPSTVDGSHVLVTTRSSSYTIDQLVTMRHYAAHGQATSAYAVLDSEMLAQMPPLLADGLERYWNALQPSLNTADDQRAVEDMHAEELCNQLAKANVLPLRGWPVLKSWILFERDKFGNHNSITTIFNRFHWHVY